MLNGIFLGSALASGAWPDRGRPGSKPGLKAGVSTARGRALAGLWPGWPRDKKTGEATALRLARPGLATADRGQN